MSHLEWGGKTKYQIVRLYLHYQTSCDRLRIRDMREIPGWAGSAPTREDGDKLLGDAQGQHKGQGKVSMRWIEKASK